MRTRLLVLLLFIIQAAFSGNKVADDYVNTGIAQFEKGSYDSAKVNFLLAIELAIKQDEKKVLANAYNNLANCYANTGNVLDALKNYQKAVSTAEEIGDSARIAKSLKNIGTVYSEQKDFLMAMQFYEEALGMARASGDRFMMAANINNMATVHSLLGNSQRALDLFFQALDTAKKINATEIIIENYDGIASVYESIKNYPEAIKYRKLYESTKNDFINSERSAQLAEMQTKYETERKENEIRNLKQNERIQELEISKQKLQLKERNNLLWGALLLIIGLGTALYFWYDKQKLKNKLAQEQAIKETEERERIRIAKDIHDDLGSGLSKINFLSAVISSKSDAYPEIKEGSESVADTARKMVENMRDLIWALNTENANLSSLISRIREYSSDYLEDFPMVFKSSFPDFIPNISISKESHRGIFMVIKESLNNIVKHAKANEIKLNVSCNEQNLIVIIEDDGIGFNSGKTFDGNGLRNMKNRIATAGGSINIQSVNGTKIMLNIPLN